MSDTTIPTGLTADAAPTPSVSGTASAAALARTLAIAESASTALIVLDPDGRCTYLNPPAAAITGAGLEELRGLPLHAAVHRHGGDGPAARAACWLERLHAGPAPLRDQEDLFFRRDGSRCRVLCAATPIRVAGEPVGTLLELRELPEETPAGSTPAPDARETALLAAICTALTRGPDLPHVLQRCCEAIVTHLDAAFARIWTMNAAEQMLELKASAGLYTHLDGPHSRVPVGALKIGLIASEGRPHLTNRVLEDPRVSDHEWARREGMIAFAGYPLLVDGEVLGVLAMFARHPLTECTLTALGAAADAVGVAIRRDRAEAEMRAARLEAEARAEEAARLAAQLQDQASELEQQVEEAQALTEELEAANEELLAASEELNQARNQAEQERNRVREVLESITDAFFAVDHEWSITVVNGALERLVNRPREALLGRSCWEELPELLPRPVQVALRRALAGRRTREVELRLAGRQRWFAVRAFPAQDGGLAVYYHDITERKQSEAAAQEEAHVVERLYRIARVLASELDLHRLVQMVTDEATGLTGAAFGAFFYNVVSDSGESYQLFTISGVPREAFERFPMPRTTPLFEPTFHGTGVVRSDDVTRHPSYGKMAPHFGMPEGHLPVRSYLAVPVVSRTGEVLGGLFFGHPEVGLFHERHERLAVGIASWAAVAMDNARLFTAERRARAEAEEANQTKSRFLASMSHELRTPLNAIGGYTDLVQLGIHGPVTPAQHEALERVKRAQQHLLGLINDVLNFARLEAGRVEFHLETVPLGATLRDVDLLIAPQAEGKRIVYRPPAGDPDAAVRADRDKVQQILLNLLSNAIKFTDPGGQISVEWEVRAEHVDIRVRDTGCGVSPDKLAAIFEPFVQVDPDLTRVRQGTGLGLAISRELARGMGGDLTAASAPGAGSTFTLSLPRAR